MTAPSHAVTGALIGITIANPGVAIVLSFLSHFICDVIPHYDRPEADVRDRIRSRRFITELILYSALLCLAIVLYLALTRPRHWFVAAVCAFMAASPDLFWIRRFIHVNRTGKDIPLNPFLRFHEQIQWKTGPMFIWVDAGWFIAGSALLVHLAIR